MQAELFSVEDVLSRQPKRRFVRRLRLAVVSGVTLAAPPNVVLVMTEHDRVWDKCLGSRRSSVRQPQQWWWSWD